MKTVIVRTPPVTVQTDPETVRTPPAAPQPWPIVGQVRQRAGRTGRVASQPTRAGFQEPSWPNLLGHHSTGWACSLGWAGAEEAGWACSLGLGRCRKATTRKRKKKFFLDFWNLFLNWIWEIQEGPPPLTKRSGRITRRPNLFYYIIFFYFGLKF